MKRSFIALTLLASSGCTAVAVSSTVGVVRWHNAVTSDENDWHYLTPVLVSAGVGLVLDLFMVHAAGKRFGGFAKPCAETVTVGTSCPR